MASRSLERVILRNHFYWENYRDVGLMIILLGLIIVSLLGFVFYQRVTFPKPKYFATYPDGLPIPIIPLKIPLQSDAFVFQWAVAAVKGIYSFDYVTYRRSLQNAEEYFTYKGYQDFIKALLVSTNLESVKFYRQVVSADTTSAPVLIRKGQLSSDLPYSWDLQIPMTITYQNSQNQVIKQVGSALIRISRDSTLRHTEGLAIDQLVFQTQ